MEYIKTVSKGAKSPPPFNLADGLRCLVFPFYMEAVKRFSENLEVQFCKKCVCVSAFIAYIGGLDYVMGIDLVDMKVPPPFLSVSL